MARFVVYGAGAVGGVIGSRLFEHGREVVLIARGAHREAIERDGLRFEFPDGALVQAVAVVGGPEEIAWRDDDIVLATMKGQDTAAALGRLADVYSVVVALPATHLVPGIVVAHSAPITGALDIGRYPEGIDLRSREIAAAFEQSGFASEPRSDVSRWKYAKFLRNVPNAVD